ncbi:MAG: hypothetical protein HYR60_11525 [Acidobacteria bacterium]|nr:hypothetical protein [Acidobacteriota bacterium]MBI3474081.1 hypothetical protein [Candidatus Solibacter usitatus]
METLSRAPAVEQAAKSGMAIIAALCRARMPEEYNDGVQPGVSDVFANTPTRF